MIKVYNPTLCPMKVTRYVRVMDIWVTLGETALIHTPSAHTQFQKLSASKENVCQDRVVYKTSIIGVSQVLSFH